MMSQEKWRRQQTKWYMQKVLFYCEDYVYQRKVVYAEVIFCYRDYVC